MSILAAAEGFLETSSSISLAGSPMPKKKTSINQGGQVSDKSANAGNVIGGIRLQLPINRNLSLKLFGQLGNLKDKRF